MKFTNTLIFGAASLFALGAGSLLADSALRDAEVTVRTTIYDITNKSSTTLNFDKGVYTLTNSQKDELEALTRAFVDDGKIESVVVVCYSDKDYPRRAKHDLSKADRTLAAKRGDHVRQALNNDGVRPITIYNMAEKAGWFEKTFVTPDAQVKGEATGANDDPTKNDAFYDALGRYVSREGGAGKVIVVMRHKA